MRDAEISDTNWSNFASISISKLSHTKQSTWEQSRGRALMSAEVGQKKSSMFAFPSSASNMPRGEIEPRFE